MSHDKKNKEILKNQPNPWKQLPGHLNIFKGEYNSFNIINIAYHRNMVLQIYQEITLSHMVYPKEMLYTSETFLMIIPDR